MIIHCCPKSDATWHLSIGLASSCSWHTSWMKPRRNQRSDLGSELWASLRASLLDSSSNNMGQFPQNLPRNFIWTCFFHCHPPPFSTSSYRETPGTVSLHMSKIHQNPRFLVTTASESHQRPMDQGATPQIAPHTVQPRSPVGHGPPTSGPCPSMATIWGISRVVKRHDMIWYDMRWHKKRWHKWANRCTYVIMTQNNNYMKVVILIHNDNLWSCLGVAIRNQQMPVVSGVHAQKGEFAWIRFI